jgi:hypothetical protein
LTDARCLFRLCVRASAARTLSISRTHRCLRAAIMVIAAPSVAA